MPRQGGRAPAALSTETTRSMGHKAARKVLKKDALGLEGNEPLQHRGAHERCRNAVAHVVRNLRDTAEGYDKHKTNLQKNFNFPKGRPSNFVDSSFLLSHG